MEDCNAAPTLAGPRQKLMNDSNEDDVDTTQ